MDYTHVATAIISAIVSTGGVQLIQSSLSHLRSSQASAGKREDAKDERAFKVLETRVGKLEVEVEECHREREADRNERVECLERYAELQHQFGRLERACEQSGILRNDMKPPSA